MNINVETPIKMVPERTEGDVSIQNNGTGCDPEQKMLIAILQTGNAKLIQKVQEGKMSIEDAYQLIMQDHGQKPDSSSVTTEIEVQKVNPLQIDPEIRNCLPDISSDALELLEQLIVEKQIEPVVKVWQGYVIDGHHAKEICEKHGLAFKVVPYEASTKVDVIIHRIELHLSRRNIPLFARIALYWQLEKYYKEKADSNKKLGRSKKALIKNDQSFQRVDTTKKIAELANAGKTSTNQVKRVLESGYQDVIDRAMLGEIPPSKAYYVVKDRQRLANRSETAHQVMTFPNPQPGEYINQIIQGDAHDVLGKIAQAHPHEITAFIFSPPYNMGLDYGTGSQGDLRPYDDYLNDLIKSLTLQRECLREGGRICLNIGLSTVPQMERDRGADYIRAVDADLIYGIRKLDCGLRFKGKIIWAKSNLRKSFTYGTNYGPEKFVLRNCWEYILIWSYKSFDLLNITGLESDITSAEYNEWTSNPWDIPSVNHGIDHPAKMPDELARRLILLNSFPGDVVCDCYAGSGTVLRVAKELKRQFVGIDLNPSYCQIAREGVLHVA